MNIMKKRLFNSILVCSIIVLFNGCDEVDNLFGKSGMKCNNQEVINLTEQILNNQIMKNSDLKLDLNNIVVWDYNKVGRYECKAKVNGVSKNGIEGTWILPVYGLSINKENNKISGWIKYNTYKTTQEMFYVEIEKATK